MDNKVKLTRTSPGFYKAMVRPIGSGIEPFVMTVCGPDPHYPNDAGYGYDWVVWTDTERFFATLREARQYINRFFENA
jgi:hypothetical protein